MSNHFHNHHTILGLYDCVRKKESFLERCPIFLIATQTAESGLDDLWGLVFFFVVDGRGTEIRYGDSVIDNLNLDGDAGGDFGVDVDEGLSVAVTSADEEALDFGDALACKDHQINKLVIDMGLEIYNVMSILSSIFH